MEKRTSPEEQLECLTGLLLAGHNLDGLKPLGATRFHATRSYNSIKGKLLDLAGSPTNWNVAINMWLREFCDPENNVVELWLLHQQAEEQARAADIRKICGFIDSALEQNLLELETKYAFSDALKKKADEIFYPPEPYPEPLVLNELFRQAGGVEAFLPTPRQIRQQRAAERAARIDEITHGRDVDWLGTPEESELDEDDNSGDVDITPRRRRH